MCFNYHKMYTELNINMNFYLILVLNIVLRKKDDPTSVAYIDWGSSKSDRHERPLNYKSRFITHTHMHIHTGTHGTHSDTKTHSDTLTHKNIHTVTYKHTQ